MSYLKMLQESAAEHNSIVCMGLDPLIEKIPLNGSVEERIVKFYSDIIDACMDEDTMPAAAKPNYAFYAQYGFPGLKALEGVIERARIAALPVILDAKRGDIGKTAEAYAREAFEFWKADCCTVSPFLGGDSIQPFAQWCREKGKGIYILNRTSNAGAAELQDLSIEGIPLFSKLSEKIIEWGASANGSIGAVVGATSLQELQQICTIFVESKKEVPLLIPGVGAQGGSASDVTNTLRKAGYDLSIVRINSSSGINYAYEAQKTDDYAGAAVKAIKQLNGEIKFKAEK